MGHGGADDVGDDRGIILRALGWLFARAADESAKYHIAFKISYVEIYLEEMKDLLSVGGQSAPQIREDRDGNTVLVGVEEREVGSLAEAVDCLVLGSHARQVAGTLMNERSSRSHTIFTVVVERTAVGDSGAAATSGCHEDGRLGGTTQGGLDLTATAATPPPPAFDGDGNEGGIGTTNRFTSSRCHFVDLAGSERAKTTGNSGVRLKE
jgi:hypothetical protein